MQQLESIPKPILPLLRPEKTNDASIDSIQPLINLFIVLLFAFLNPMYAISICAVLNITSCRINFILFSVMFAGSFALFFLIRDWGISGDPIEYLRQYRLAGSQSLSNIYNQFKQLPTGHEPLWKVYLWLFQRLFGFHVRFFAFTNYFLIFFLTASLGRLINKKRFVVIIISIIFLNPGFLYNVFEVWRHTFAVLLFYIGIFLIEAKNHKKLSRVVLYSSGLFHLLAFVLIILYELLTLCSIKNRNLEGSNRLPTVKWYSFEVLPYAIIILTLLKFSEQYGVNIIAYFRLAMYPIYFNKPFFGYNYLFNPLTYVIIIYFWYNQKKLTKNDIFIGVNYFVVTLSLILIQLPSVAIGRLYYCLLLGGAILVGKLILTHLRFGLICLLIIIYYSIHIYMEPEGAKSLITLLGGDFMNPVCGLLWMASNYSSILVLSAGSL